MGVRSSIDSGRLAETVKRPGIDPRIWLVQAVVRDVAFDPDHGMFADVQYMPDGDQVTCLIGASYAGNGLGFFVPPKVDDIVVVAVPMGDPGTGPVIVARLWSGSDKPPSDFKSASSSNAMDATTDPVLAVEPGAALRVVAKAGANVLFDVQDAGNFTVKASGAATVNVTGESTVTVNSPDVRLGDSPGQPIARIGDIVSGALPLLVSPPGMPGGPILQIPGPGTIAFVGQIMSGKTGVKA